MVAMSDCVAVPFVCLLYPSLPQQEKLREQGIIAEELLVLTFWVRKAEDGERTAIII